MAAGGRQAGGSHQTQRGKELAKAPPEEGGYHCSQHLKILTIDMQASANSGLTDLAFDQVTGQILSSIEATVDHWLQADVIDIDAQRTGGLLELAFPGGGKIVINTQPPLHELWLAARAGGFHFRHLHGRWIDRSGLEFFEVLSARASEQAGKGLHFRAPDA